MIFVVDPPADPAPSAGDAAQDAAPDVSSAIVPEDLVSIRAYVRWEEAGMPEDTTPEWQATEFARARLDLQMEVLDGVSLNGSVAGTTRPPSPATTSPSSPGVPSWTPRR